MRRNIVMLKCALDLLHFTKECCDNMHEPDEQGFRFVHLVGDHLDNAFGNDIDIIRSITGGYQEYVLLIEKNRDDDVKPREVLQINLANLIALAKIGAKHVVRHGEV